MEEQATQTYVDEKISRALDFSTKKIGDIPTDAIQLTPKQYVDGQISSVISSVNGTISSIASETSAVFGVGGDGALTFNGSTSYSIASIISSSVYALTRDIYATTLVISAGVTVHPMQYRIFASSVLQATNASIIAKGGNANGNTGGASKAAGYFPAIPAGVNGGGGGQTPPGPGGGNAGSNGNDGFSVTHSLVGDGVTTRSASTLSGGPADAFLGGKGGNNVAGGIGSSNVIAPIPIWGVQYFLDVNPDATLSKMTTGAGSASAPGGGSGARSSGNQPAGNGGSGGGAGGNGGWIALYAKHISLPAGNILDVRGGNGGNGNPGSTPSIVASGQAGGGAGGNGGSGGQGGLVVLAYDTIVNQASILVSGGTFGTGGSGAPGIQGGGAGDPGLAGFSGNDGRLLTYQMVN